MSFSQAEIENIIIKHVHLQRATKEHAEKFKKFLLKEINDNKDKLIIDLSECEFIDSTFISVLVIALKTVNQNNGSLKIIAVHSTVQSILELTGMVKVFEVFNSVNEAVASFNQINFPS